MILAPSIAPADADKLKLLRKVDRFRSWYSLDDKRYCLVCGKIITGQEIQIAGGARRDDALRLTCPSDHCNSIPLDWVLPTDEILARAEMLATKEIKAATSRFVNHGGNPARGVGWKLWYFASYFKRSS